jgi:hypothetical protein
MTLVHFTLVTKGYKHILSQYVIITVFFHCNNGCAKAPQRYVVRELSFLLIMNFISRNKTQVKVIKDVSLTASEFFEH